MFCGNQEGLGLYSTMNKCRVKAAGTDRERRQRPRAQRAGAALDSYRSWSGRAKPPRGRRAFCPLSNERHSRSQGSRIASRLLSKPPARTALTNSFTLEWQWLIANIIIPPPPGLRLSFFRKGRSCRVGFQAVRNRPRASPKAQKSLLPFLPTKPNPTHNTASLCFLSLYNDIKEFGESRQRHTRKY